MRAKQSLLFLALFLTASTAHLFPQEQAQHAPVSAENLRATPSPRDLPNDCAITATEAASRLAATGAWTRIIFIVYRDLDSMRPVGHVLAVWQPPTAHVVCIYDGGGTWDLDTRQHQAVPIATEWARIYRVSLIEAHFIK